MGPDRGGNPVRDPIQGWLKPRLAFYSAPEREDGLDSSLILFAIPSRSSLDECHAIN